MIILNLEKKEEGPAIVEMKTHIQNTLDYFLLMLGVSVARSSTMVVPVHGFIQHFAK